MVRAGTGSDIVQGPGYGLGEVREMNLDEGRNLSMSQDGDGTGVLSRIRAVTRLLPEPEVCAGTGSSPEPGAR